MVDKEKYDDAQVDGVTINNTHDEEGANKNDASKSDDYDHNAVGNDSGDNIDKDDDKVGTNSGFVAITTAIATGTKVALTREREKQSNF